MNRAFAPLAAPVQFLALCAACCFLASSAQSADTRAAGQISPQISNSTVRIRVETDTRGHLVVGHGSAFGVDLSAYGILKNRYLLSAAHLVLDNAGNLSSGRISVELPRGNNRKLWARCHVLSVTRFYDLCLLECDEDVPVVSKLTPGKPGMAVGTSLLVVGCPLGVPPQVSAGFLSDKEPLVNERYHRVWEATAAFNHGNSGGPVFSADKGTVVGVAVAGVRAGGGGPQDMDPGIALFTPYYCVKHFLDVSIAKMAKKI